jgi:hypothetical protein
MFNYIKFTDYNFSGNAEALNACLKTYQAWFNYKLNLRYGKNQQYAGVPIISKIASQSIGAKIRPYFLSLL